MKPQKLIKVIDDLMKSHDELMTGIANAVVDFGLLNECRINGAKAITELETELNYFCGMCDRPNDTNSTMCSSCSKIAF